MNSFVKYFGGDNMKELEKEINDYIEHTDNELEVAAISVVPSPYHAYFTAIVAFRRAGGEK